MLNHIFPSLKSGAYPTLTVGGVSFTEEQEKVHTLLVGSTGTGKTTAIEEMLLTTSTRGDRMIVVDANGHYASKFATNEDVILNVFDKRTPKWNPFAEIHKEYDFDKIARSIIPDGFGHDASWHFYAQVLIADTMRALLADGKGNVSELIKVLTTSSAEDLKSLLIGSIAEGLFDKDAAKALASTRFILSAYLKPLSYLKEGNFSLRKFLESNRQKLFITWREDMTASVAPLIACWVDVICNAILSKPVSENNPRTWLVLDELATLSKVSSLEAVLTKGRKHNLVCIAGLQSTAQLDRVYGQETSIILRSCFRNLVAFAIAKADPQTTELISQSLGESEVDRIIESTSRNKQEVTSTASTQRVRERLVLPSEINELPNLTAYLSLAGNYPTRKIRLSPQNLPCVTAAFME